MSNKLEGHGAIKLPQEEHWASLAVPKPKVALSTKKQGTGHDTHHPGSSAHIDIPKKFKAH